MNVALAASLRRMRPCESRGAEEALDGLVPRGLVDLRLPVLFPCVAWRPSFDAATSDGDTTTNETRTAAAGWRTFIGVPFGRASVVPRRRPFAKLALAGADGSCRRLF